MKNLKLSLLPLFAFVFLAFGCDEIDEAFDCQTLCNELKACDNSALDVSVCEDRCFDRAEADRTFRRDLDQCDACLDTNNLACNEIPNTCSVCVTVGDHLFNNQSGADSGMQDAATNP